MSNTFGKAIRVTLFGESHGSAIGAVIDGLPPGLKVDPAYIMAEMDKRRPVGNISTARKEADVPEFISGVKDGFTEGTPVAIIIKNTDAKSGDYRKTEGLARPSHADYTAEAKYLGFQDASGGGHFSGRLTAALVAAGAIIRMALEAKGITIGTHIKSLGEIEDESLLSESAQVLCGAEASSISPETLPTVSSQTEALAEKLRRLNASQFPVLDREAAEKMKALIESARSENDSVGGILETAVTGLEPGIGEPWFDSIESELAHAMFSIPGVKGVEFGAGFAIAKLKGSLANDPFAIENGRIVTLTNNSGGINGGISNGMPVVFRTAVKPTPSISKPQITVDFKEMKDAELIIQGRHDPAIVHRARAVVDAMTAIVIADLLARRFGYLSLRSEP